MIGFSMGCTRWGGNWASVILQIPIAFVPPLNRRHHQPAPDDWRFALVSLHGRRASDGPGKPLHLMRPANRHGVRPLDARGGAKRSLSRRRRHRASRLRDMRAGWSLTNVAWFEGVELARTGTRGLQDAGLDSLGVANAARSAGVRHVASPGRGGAIDLVPHELERRPGDRPGHLSHRAPRRPAVRRSRVRSVDASRCGLRSRCVPSVAGAARRDGNDVAR